MMGRKNNPFFSGNKGTGWKLTTLPTVRVTYPKTDQNDLDSLIAVKAAIFKLSCCIQWIIIQNVVSDPPNETTA
jgi:hypothetical protein